MTPEARRQLVHRLDVLFFAGLLLTSGLAALLFWTQFYDNEETAAQVASETPTPTLGITLIPVVTSTLTPTPTPTPSATITPVVWPTPVVAPLALAEIYAGQSFTLSGSAQPGDRIEVYDGGTLIGSTTADASGAWMLRLIEGLDAGTHLLSVLAVGPEGVTSRGAPVGFQVIPMPTNTPSSTPSSTPTNTISPTLTKTPSPTITPSPTATLTPSPSPSATPAPTRTHTATPSPVPPTDTPAAAAIIPSYTRSPTPTPTITPSPFPPTETNTPTVTLTVTPSPLPPTSTNTATFTATPSPLPPTSTNTATFTATPSPIPPTETSTPTATPTPTATFTVTPSLVPPTSTSTATHTHTSTVTPSPVPPTAAVMVPSGTPVFLHPRIDAPRSGEVYSPGTLVVRGTAEPGMVVQVQREGTETSLASVPVAADGTWQTTITLSAEGEVTLVAIMPVPGSAALVSDPVTIRLAPPMQPQTGASSARDPQDTGRAFTALVALLLVAGGFSAYFAGRLLFLLARDRMG